LRDKSRYLLVESNIDIAESDREQFTFALYNGLLHSIGESNYHVVNPKVVDFVEKSRFIIKSSLVGYNKLILAFALIKKMEGMDVYFYTLKSSGTIKALNSFKY
jgi:RNase P/RNase MRP subunit POP5